MDRLGRDRVVRLQRLEHGVAQDDAPAERVAGPVALEHDDLVLGASQLRRDREVEPGRASADAGDPHGSYLILEIDWRVKIRSPDVQFARHVSWNDCDPSGRIRYNAAFDWFVDAEVAFLRSLGMSSAFDRMPRVAASATYRLPLRFEDEIVVEVNVAKVGRSAVTYAFQRHARQARKPWSAR